MGSFEILSIVLPRTSTFMLALSCSLLPSKMRTFLNRVSRWFCGVHGMYETKHGAEG